MEDALPADLRVQMKLARPVEPESRPANQWKDITWVHTVGRCLHLGTVCQSCVREWSRDWTIRAQSRSQGWDAEGADAVKRLRGK